MSLGKRHIGRRVAGVGVAVALMMLGLEAPAFAAPVVVTGISPSSGPAGCVVVVTGTGFDQPGAFAIDEVAFTGAGVISGAPADFTVVSDTEIWTTAPGTVETGAITVTDDSTDPDTIGTSSVFTVTSDAGTCTPTIASFTPLCGVVGTVVTLTGTNLLSDSGDSIATPAVDPTGGDVFFNPYATPATPTGAAVSPTTLVVNVPASAVDGPIRVDTSLSAGDDNADSATSFDVVADAALCVPPTPTSHARSISLTLKKHLVAKGKVSSTEDPAFTDCVASVPVKIQRKTKSGWKNVGSTTTTSTGSYKKTLKDKPGKYRAIAKKVGLGDPVTDVCKKATSAVRKHSH